MFTRPVAVIIAAMLVSIATPGCASGLKSSILPADDGKSQSATLRSYESISSRLGVAESVNGQFHLSRDGQSRVYDHHVEFILKGYTITGHVTGFVLRPGNRVNILADFANGDAVHIELASVATISALEVRSRMERQEKSLSSVSLTRGKPLLFVSASL